MEPCLLEASIAVKKDHAAHAGQLQQSLPQCPRPRLPWRDQSCSGWDIARSGWDIALVSEVQTDYRRLGKGFLNLSAEVSWAYLDALEVMETLSGLPAAVVESQQVFAILSGF